MIRSRNISASNVSSERAPDEDMDIRDTKGGYCYRDSRCICFTILLFCIIYVLGFYHAYQSHIALSDLLEENIGDLQDCQSETTEKDQIIVKLEADISEMQRKVPLQTSPRKSEHFHSALPGSRDLSEYNLRDVLFLPRGTPDNDVMQSFVQRWQLRSNLYGHCGRITSRAAYQPPLFPSEKCNVAVVSSWYPRPCGIATFSSKLVEGLRHICPPGSAIDVIAVRNQDEKDTLFPPIVRHTMEKEDLHQYVKTADWINERNYGMVIMNYEFGLYADELFLCLLRGIRSAMVVTVLHTLADNLPLQKHALTQQAVLQSHKMVVMTDAMARKMDLIHRVPPQIVEVIPHGVPVLPHGQMDPYKSQSVFGTNNRIIFSNGLIHQGKGLEYAIEAMTDVIKLYPTAVLVIQGKPHPTGEGTEEYYRNLRGQVVSRGLEDHVMFNRTFLPDEELWDNLMSSDVYINPYVDEAAAVSGTLIMAMAMGLPCISTTYPFAVEALADGRGILIPFRDAHMLAGAIGYALEDTDRAREMGGRARKYTKTWDQVAQKFLNLLVK